MSKNWNDDDELRSLRIDHSQFDQHYEEGYNFLTLRVLLYHCLDYLFSIKDHIKKNDNMEGKPPLKV